MKIKHYAGYGCVNAKKVGMIKTNGNTLLEVVVSGNHEQGIETHDNAVLKKWLVDRFDKEAESINAWDMRVDVAGKYVPGGEVAVYVFYYKV